MVVDAVAQAFEVAATDHGHGASAIERRLLADLLAARGAWTAANLGAGAVALARAHPAMANLRALALRLDSAAGPDLEAWLRGRLEALAGLAEQLGRQAWPIVSPCRCVVTVSCSSAVAAVVTEATRRGWRGRVVVLDGTPSGGGQHQADMLRAAGVAARSQPDGTAPGWLLPGAIVFVGADAVGPHSFVNATGTRGLLTLARQLEVAGWLVADRGKDVPETVVDELLTGVRTAAEPGPGREWPVFERVPTHLVAGRLDGEPPRPGSC